MRMVASKSGVSLVHWFISHNQISFFRGANVHRSHMGPIRDSGRGWGAGGGGGLESGTYK